MSWSASAPAAASGQTTVALPSSPFVYPELSPGEPPDAADTDRPDSELSQAQTRRSSWEEGKAAGRAELCSQTEEQIRQERHALIAALEQFAIDRAEYFEKVENEVVQLALAIARKILHRELQTDPLALAGLVRVALERVGEVTSNRLRVRPQKAAAWREQLSVEAAGKKLEVMEDAALDGDACILETSLGTVDLSLEVQLKEIETGLMDLQAVRPGVKR